MTSSIDPHLHEQAMQLFVDLISRKEALAQEYFTSRREFLGPAATGTLNDDEFERVFEEDGTRPRRHLEWFLFERSSKTLEALPVDALNQDWIELASEAFDEVPVAMLQNLCGVFEVLEIQPDGQIDLRDLAGLTNISMRPRTGSAGFAHGDLLVGRFYAAEEGLHQPSAAILTLRDLDLLTALRQDIERLRKARAHAVMRLSQFELERMFWDSASSASQGSAKRKVDPVSEMEAFFKGAGIHAQIISAWKRILHTPQEATTLAAGSGDLVGGLLEQLAFETSVDLGKARAHLLAAWTALTTQPAKAPRDIIPTPTPEDLMTPDEVAESLREFDVDRSAGIDVGKSFEELERRLGLDADEEEDTGDAPDFPGVVGAMVEEFLWERGLTDAAAVEPWKVGLRLFGEYTAKVGVFENLSERDVLSFLTFWLPESRRLATGQAAGDLVRGIYAFASWAAEAHCVEILGTDLATESDSLQDGLSRVTEANLGLPKDAGDAAELFECCGPCTSEGTRIRDQQGEERDVLFAIQLVECLQPGDLLRGYTRDDGRFVIGCCYPAQARGLKQRTA